MKSIIVLFDSLNRHFLPNYGCEWTHAPNFKRLAEHTLTFDRSYVCSMPCMPARRDMHTGRPNFLHCPWSPLHPYDDSVYEHLRYNGVHTHLVSDHYHYWEDGGANYHARFTTWEAVRGQEGDPWYGQVRNLPEPSNQMHQVRQQDQKNRQPVREGTQPHWQDQTFQLGIEFVRRNHSEDNWLLQIETFDPHEPFFSDPRYQRIYEKHFLHYKGRNGDWPHYNYLHSLEEDTPEEVEHMRYVYAALLSQCDANLGRILDLMDELNLWEDTQLIVCTDHGFFLGEHDLWAKVWCPFYEEVAHTPFFVWDPRYGKAGQRRNALVQPSIDLPPTLLDFFGMEAMPDMTGKNLAPVIKDDTPVRDALLFGVHARQVNIVTDDGYYYIRGPVREDNAPICTYTLMPAHMKHRFRPDEIPADTELAPPFSFTKGMPTLKLKLGPPPGHWGKTLHQTELYNLNNDPGQQNPLDEPETVERLCNRMKELMAEVDAPTEQYERLGLPL